MNLCHIVAMSENRVIGKDGTMPWHIPAELKHFKETTMGHCMLMGRKTFESIGKPLPGRLNVVVTRQDDFDHPAGVVVAHDLDEAFDVCRKAVEAGRFGPDTFIIGGGQIYRETLDLVDRIHLTVIHHQIDGDTFYPEINLNQFSIFKEEKFQEPVPYTTQVLVRER